jgi:hypothetical protein
MASPSIQNDLAFVIIGELQDIRSEIRRLSASAVIGGGKEWLKPAEFSRLCKLTTRTLSVYVSERRFSDRAVRRVKRGSSFTNEFHRVIALNEVQNIKTVLRR